MAKASYGYVDKKGDAHNVIYITMAHQAMWTASTPCYELAGLKFPQINSCHMAASWQRDSEHTPAKKNAVQ